MSISYDDWLGLTVPTMGVLAETTMEDAMLDFFYSGVSPWIHGCGYRWSLERDEVAGKFLYFCYIIYTTMRLRGPRGHWALQAPKPRHRDLPEDADTFDIFAELSTFSDMLYQWRERCEIVGTRFDYLIRDFCYVWVDVEYGEPGRWSETTMEMNGTGQSEEDSAMGMGASASADFRSGKRKNDLY
jgi:hypothetical protein